MTCRYFQSTVVRCFVVLAFPVSGFSPPDGRRILHNNVANRSWARQDLSSNHAHGNFSRLSFPSLGCHREGDRLGKKLWKLIWKARFESCKSFLCDPSMLSIPYLVSVEGAHSCEILGFCNVGTIRRVVSFYFRAWNESVYGESRKFIALLSVLATISRAFVISLSFQEHVFGINGNSKKRKTSVTVLNSFLDIFCYLPLSRLAKDSGLFL